MNLKVYQKLLNIQNNYDYFTKFENLMKYFKISKF